MLVHICLHMYACLFMLACICLRMYACPYMFACLCLSYRSDRACVICRCRAGWSLMRMGTPHGKAQVQRLWHLAIDTPRIRGRGDLQRAQRRAREKLYRHGFHTKYRCTLLDHAKNILLRDPDAPRVPLFASVIYYDLLHWESNVCDYVFGAVLGVMDKTSKEACDRNTHALPMLRNPDGSGIRRFTQVYNINHICLLACICLSMQYKSYMLAYICLSMQYKSYMLTCICLLMHACPCNMNHICLSMQY